MLANLVTNAIEAAVITLLKLYLQAHMWSEARTLIHTYTHTCLTMSAYLRAGSGSMVAYVNFVRQPEGGGASAK